MFILAFVFLVLMFILSYLEENYFALLAVDLAIIFWGTEKCLCWFLGERISIANQVAIPQDAPKVLRTVGLCFGGFVVGYGIFDIAERLTT